jgi:hypothetical protein
LATSEEMIRQDWRDAAQRTAESAGFSQRHRTLSFCASETHWEKEESTKLFLISNNTSPSAICAGLTGARRMEYFGATFF